MVFQKRWYTLKLDLSFCYIFYVLKIISFRLKEEKRSLDAGRSRAYCRFLLFFTAPPGMVYYDQDPYRIEIEFNRVVGKENRFVGGKGAL